jgi:Zn finger protein HypA/HybF involved in hydrogenase expression
VRVHSQHRESARNTALQLANRRPTGDEWLANDKVIHTTPERNDGMNCPHCGSEDVRVITRDDLRTMTPEEITEAHDEGKLSALLRKDE